MHLSSLSDKRSAEGVQFNSIAKLVPCSAGLFIIQILVIDVVDKSELVLLWSVRGHINTRLGCCCLLFRLHFLSSLAVFLFPSSSLFSHHCPFIDSQLILLQRTS